jgi:hypothetical protein
MKQVFSSPAMRLFEELLFRRSAIDMESPVMVYVPYGCSLKAPIPIG